MHVILEGRSSTPTELAERLVNDVNNLAPMRTSDSATANIDNSGRFS